jgi:hypothetical protein
VSWKLGFDCEMKCFEKAQGIEQNLIRPILKVTQTASSLSLFFQNLATLACVRLINIEGVDNYKRTKCFISKVIVHPYSICSHF